MWEQCFSRGCWVFCFSCYLSETKGVFFEKGNFPPDSRILHDRNAKGGGLQKQISPMGNIDLLELTAITKMYFYVKKSF